MRTSSIINISCKGILAIASLMCSKEILCQASAPTVADNPVTSIGTTGLPQAASKEGDSETVNLNTGALNMFIPVLAIPQRIGAQPLVLGYTYDSNQLNFQSIVNAIPSYWDGDHSVNPCNPGSDPCQPIDEFDYTITAAESGISQTPLQPNMPRLIGSVEYMGDAIIDASAYGYPAFFQILPQFCITNVAFIDWAGSAHSFSGTATSCQLNEASDELPIRIANGQYADSTDNQFYRLDASDLTTIKVISPDGTVYKFSGVNTLCLDRTLDCVSTTSSQEQFINKIFSTITDRNGNVITYDNGVITDTIGRSIGVNITTSAVTYTYKDSNGNSQTISMAQRSGTEKIDGMSGPDVGPVLSKNSCWLTVNELAPLPATQYKLTVESTLQPPDGNGGPAGDGYIPYDISYSGSNLKYHMLFDSFGHLMKIVYPAGGYHRYTYQTNTVSMPETSVTPYQCAWTKVLVANRYECRNSNSTCSSSEEDATTYSLLTSGIVTSPDGSKARHYFEKSVMIFSPVDAYPIETKTEYMSSAGTVLKTVNNTYTVSSSSSSYAANPFPQSIVTTYNESSSSPTTTTSYTYDVVGNSCAYFGITSDCTALSDNHIGNPTQTILYDYSSNAFATSSTGWYHTSNIFVPTNTTGNDNVFNLTHTTVNSLDSHGNITRKTITGSGATEQDYTYTLTSDAYNRPTSVVDGLGNTTTYSYSDSWSDASCAPASQSYAYLTKITNAKGYSTSYKYNSCTGNIASIIDTNNQETLYSYDSLGRITKVSYPDGGWNQSIYTDSPPLSLETKNAIGMDSVSIYDGLSRVVQTQTLDPDGEVYVDTSYDAMGRIYSVSTPYRNTSEKTYGVTYYYYDALGRKVELVYPDGKKEWWCYDGVKDPNHSQPNCKSNSTKLTGTWYDHQNENGYDWQYINDAAGNIIGVVEPTGSETDYSYDGFNNVHAVSQGGTSSETARNRTFQYTGLSQLIFSYNPESGYVCYGTSSGSKPTGSNCKASYDAVGNLLSKTDARGITTAYTYDSLNRILSKTYLYDLYATPISCYQYDSASNGKGRLSSVWTQVPSSGSSCPSQVPSSGFLTKREIVAYDAMGRIQNEMRYTPSFSTSGVSSPSCGTGSVAGISYCYDAAGNVTFSSNGIDKSTYPTRVTSQLSGGASPIEFKNTYDTAGHLKSIASNWSNSSTYPGTLFSSGTTLSSACEGATSTAYAPSGALANATLSNAIYLSKTYDVRLRPSCINGAASGTSTTQTSGSATVLILGEEQKK